LKERQDKYTIVKNIFEKLKIPVRFYITNKNPISGRIGCFMSHINVITKAYEEGHNKILIFEDDIIPTESYNETTLQYIINYLNSNNDCEYFQLGYTILPHELLTFARAPFLSKNVIKYTGNTTHAYIINKKGMKRVIDTWETYKDMQIDLYYKEIFINRSASVCPMMFDQNFCIANDNEKPSSIYYTIMRNVSCYVTFIKLMHTITYLKVYLYTYYLLFVLLFIILLLLLYGF
jgi:GR25 family glycosyltransferase involved in LPS biosynthesis